jgi:quinol monooxygenase YgiN
MLPLSRGNGLWCRICGVALDTKLDRTAWRLSTVSEETSYIVTYIEVAPASADAAAALLMQGAEASCKADGNHRTETLRRAAPSNQFALVSIWRDRLAFDAARGSTGMKDAMDKIGPHLITGVDRRFHNALVGGPDIARGKGSFFVVTHIDVPPPNKDACIELVHAQVRASRGDKGCVRYEVFQQADRPNHFSVVEVWSSRADFDAHIVAPHTRDFRMKLTPLSGGLYDERYYEAAK